MDVSNLNLDTPIEIKIMEPGYYLPELETYTPVDCYASVEQAITIMNRGIPVEFPQQSEKREISNKIEEIILDYEEKKMEIAEKHNKNVGSDLKKALDTVQEINESKRSIEEEIEERDSRVFDYREETERIVRGLSDNNIERLLKSDEFMNESGKDRLSQYEKERKQKEIIKEKRKIALKQHKIEAEALKRLAQDAKYDIEMIKNAEQIEDL